MLSKLLIVLLFLCATLTPTSTSARSKPKVEDQPVHLADLSPTEQKDIRSIIEQAVRQGLARRKQGDVLRGVRIDVEQNIVIVDLSASVLPKGLEHVSSELEQFTDDIKGNIIGAIETGLDVVISGYTFTFDGRGLDHYYPLDYPPEESSAAHSQARSNFAGTYVVLSAGHGYRRDFDQDPPTWIFQRGLHHGVQEDLHTQVLTGRLRTYFLERNELQPALVRSTSTTNHIPSGHPWNEVAARYHLQELFPNEKDIWNSLPKLMTDRREEEEDIRSRPLYANWIDAAGIISVHSNGEDTGTARGARIITQPGRLADHNLSSKHAVLHERNNSIAGWLRILYCFIWTACRR